MHCSLLKQEKTPWNPHANYHPPVIKHGKGRYTHVYSIHYEFITVIFLARTPHGNEWMSSQPCLMKPEGTSNFRRRLGASLAAANMDLDGWDCASTLKGVAPPRISKKYAFVSWDDDIPNIWKSIQHVPNHQAGGIGPNPHKSYRTYHPACSINWAIIVAWGP